MPLWGLMQPITVRASSMVLTMITGRPFQVLCHACCALFGFSPGLFTSSSWSRSPRPTSRSGAPPPNAPRSRTLHPAYRSALTMAAWFVSRLPCFLNAPSLRMVLNRSFRRRAISLCVFRGGQSRMMEFPRREGGVHSLLPFNASWATIMAARSLSATAFFALLMSC